MDNRTIEQVRDNETKLIKEIEVLETQLKKQKEVIDKINNYLDNYDVFKVFNFPLMKKWEEQEVDRKSTRLNSSH